MSTQQQPVEILVVDDNQEMMTLLRTYLSDPAIIVTTADSGKQGVAEFKNRSFDLVLLDIEMPGMNGYQACAAMRQFEREQSRAKSPILALTASSDFVSSHNILASGFDLHVVKPISRVTLFQIVGQFRQKRAGKGSAGEAGCDHDTAQTNLTLV